MAVAETIPIDEGAIWKSLETHKHSDAGHIREVLAKARELKGLDPDDIAALMPISDPDLLHELFDTARYAKDEIYGKRLVLFAPLYISNLCQNECLYCAFRARNKDVQRRALTQEEIAREVQALIEQGHKRVLLVAGESYPTEGFSYVLKAVDTIYKTKSGNGEIRRVNVNVAPLTLDEFKQLRRPRSAPTRSFRKPTTVKRTRRFIWPG